MRVIADTLPVAEEIDARGRRTLRLRGHDPVRAVGVLATRWMQQ
jgi:hypothetical protein